MSIPRRMPRDGWGHTHEIGDAIQVLYPDVAGAHQTVGLSVTTARSTAIPAGSVVELNSDVDCFVRFGDGTVDAALDDLPVWAKTPRVYHMYESAYVAGIVASGTGKLYITVLK